MFVTLTTSEILCNPPGSQLWSVVRTLLDCDPSGANDTAPFLRSSGSRNDVIRSLLVKEVLFLHLGTMDQNWVELFHNVQTAPRIHICVDATHFAVFLCKLPQQGNQGDRDSFDMSSLVGSTAGASYGRAI